jgi:hypothetical protein
MPAILDIEFPFGIAIQQWFCPVCGEPVLVDDFESENPACPHVDWIYLDDVCEFLWLKPEVAELLDGAESGEDVSQEDMASGADEDSEEEDTGLDALIRAWDGEAKAVFAFTTGGMACGPVWSTIRIGFDFSIPPSDQA